MIEIRTLIGRIVRFVLGLLPKQNKIVFVNFLGCGYGDSPKYIANEIIRQSLPYDMVWLVNDLSEPMPHGIRKVKFYGLKSCYELSTARIIVSNTKGRLPYLKKRSQYYIQTWHGGFGVKYIEKDAEQFLDKKYVRDSKYDSSITDLILSGSEFQTKVINDSFWYNGEIFKKGVPRNDIFFNASESLVVKIKQHFGIDAKSKVALYAPTFREDYSVDAYRLETTKLLHALKSRTGDDWKLIIRLHPYISGKSNVFHYDDNILNGSDYSDSQELVVMSDMLVTDFSSIMMDFAIMKKPVFMFILDLEDYIQKSRCIRPLFYQLPFDLCQSNEELCEGIINFDFDNYNKRLDDFMNTNFQSYDDGHASESVVERIKDRMS